MLTRGRWLTPRRRVDWSYRHRRVARRRCLAARGVGADAPRASRLLQRQRQPRPARMPIAPTTSASRISSNTTTTPRPRASAARSRSIRSSRSRASTSRSRSSTCPISPASMKEAQAAVAADPKAPQPHYILGLIAKSENRVDDAVAEFRQVLAIDTTRPWRARQPRAAADAAPRVRRGGRAAASGGRGRARTTSPRSTTSASR